MVTKERRRQIHRAWVLRNIEKERARHRAAQSTEAHKEYMRAYRKKNAEKLAAYMREYHSKNRDQDLERSRMWRINNLEKSKQQVKDWQMNHRQEIRENSKAKRAQRIEYNRLHRVLNPLTEFQREVARLRTREWYKNNHERHLLNCRARRNRKRASSGSFTSRDVELLIVRQSWKCANLACRKSIRSGYHIDHIIPLCVSSDNSPENIQLLCPSCNLRKSAKSPDRWAKENGLLF